MSNHGRDYFDDPCSRSAPAWGNVKDDGKPREVFGHGGERESAAGKGRFDLVPPIPLKRLAQHYENGAKKYAERNWEKGLVLGRFLDSALRHLNEYKDGDRSEDHLAAAAWNVFGFIHTEAMIRRGKLPPELDDANYLQDVPPKE